MSTQFQKEKFLWLWKRTGLIPPPELIQEDQKPRSWEQLIDGTVEQLDSDESDQLTELLRKLVCLDSHLETIDTLAGDLTDSLECTETHDGEEINQAGFICVGLSNVFDQLQTIYSIVGQLAAEQEVGS